MVAFHKQVHIRALEMFLMHTTAVTTCSFLIRILPDDYAGAPLLWSSQSEPADAFLPMKKTKKTVMLGKACVHIALETMPHWNISKHTKKQSRQLNG